MTIARNTALDRLRSRKVRPTPESLEEMAHALDPQPNTSTANEVVNNETAAIVRKALETLPNEQRHAISLAFFIGLTQTEIAESLGQPLGTVKARIRRGMLRLRSLLGELEPFSPSSTSS